jgi:hypothetical protein
MEVYKFFQETERMEQVGPLDRLMVCWNHLVEDTRDAWETLETVVKGQRKDPAVLRRLMILQARMIALPYSIPYYMTGQEMVDHVAGREEWQGPSRKVTRERSVSKGGQGKKGKGRLKNPDPYKTKKSKR